MDTRYGLLIRGYDYSNLAEDEFNDWYDTEHIPERERTQGFVTAQRWLGVADPKISVAMYDLESIDVLQSPQYKAISGAALGPWSRRIVGRARAICHFQAEQLSPGKVAAPGDAGGLLMFAVNVPAEAEADYNAWLDEEHLARLAAVPGVLCARRFRMAGGSHRYLQTYHLSAPEVESSQAWKDAVGTPWSARMRPHFRDALRLVLRRYVRKP